MRRHLIRVTVAALMAGVVLAWAWRHFDIGHAPFEKMAKLHGQELETILGDLGGPTRAFEFPMSMCLGEFRCELFNVYPPHNPSTADVRIKELLWEYGRYSITVWFHRVNGRWVALDSYRVQAGWVS